MQNLEQGSTGPAVELLQRLLNLKQGKKILNEDGAFGRKTTGEVKSFQARNWLTPDGIVGEQSWRALGLKIDIDHRVTLVPQTSNLTCWSAAATMLFGTMPAGSGLAAVGASGGSPSDAVAVFARNLRLTVHAPTTWAVQGLAALLGRGPLWVGGVPPRGSSKGAESGHAVVVGSMWGTGEADGTILRILDPRPVATGSVYGSFYGESIAGAPLHTTYILHR